jgi:hypothetical protein
MESITSRTPLSAWNMLADGLLVTGSNARSNQLKDILFARSVQ